jgi:hypothetical protein
MLLAGVVLLPQALRARSAKSAMIEIAEFGRRELARCAVVTLNAPRCWRRLRLAQSKRGSVSGDCFNRVTDESRLDDDWFAGASEQIFRTHKRKNPPTFVGGLFRV